VDYLKIHIWFSFGSTEESRSRDSRYLDQDSTWRPLAHVAARFGANLATDVGPCGTLAQRMRVAAIFIGSFILEIPKYYMKLFANSFRSPNYNYRLMPNA
jgi:hypothetical protein